MDNPNNFKYQLEHSALKMLHSEIFVVSEIANRSNKYISKIYTKINDKYYKNENTILEILSKKLKNNTSSKYIIENFSNTGKILPDQSVNFSSNQYFIFKYYTKFVLEDYLINQQNIIQEIFIKLICYKILKGIQYCHDCNICHNNLNIKNIIFDENFTPVIIDFSDSINLNENNNLTKEKIIKYKNKDFYQLALILINLITDGKKEPIKKYLTDHEGESFFIRKNGDKIEESKFWKMIKKNSRKNISNDFIDFFIVLINPKQELNISFLINELKWLIEFRDDFNNKNNDYILKIENQFFTDFQSRYEHIITFKNESHNLNIELDNYLEPMNNNIQLIFRS